MPKKWKNNFFFSSDSKVFEISMNKTPKKAYSAPPVWPRHFFMPKIESPQNFAYYTCITCMWVILNLAPKTYTCKLFILPIFLSRLGINFLKNNVKKKLFWHFFHKIKVIDNLYIRKLTAYFIFVQPPIWCVGFFWVKKKKKFDLKFFVIKQKL